MREEGSRVAASLVMVSALALGSPVRGGPVGGVARVVVHVLVSLSVGQLQGGSPCAGCQGGLV